MVEVESEMSANHKARDEVLQALEAEQRRVVNLIGRKAEIEAALAHEFQRKRLGQKNLDSGEPGPLPLQDKSCADLENLSQMLQRSSILHQMEADLCFQVDVIRLKEDLASSLAELRDLTEPNKEQHRQKLKCFQTCVDAIQIISESLSKHKVRERSQAYSNMYEASGEAFSNTVEEFLLSECERLRREVGVFLLDLLETRCGQSWPPQITLSKTIDGAPLIFETIKGEDAESFQLLSDTLRVMCVLQGSYQALQEDDHKGEVVAVATKDKDKKPLWMIDPLLDDFKRKTCFHFGQQGGSTFRLDKPEWLLKYGLHAAAAFKREGKALSAAIDGTVLDSVYSIPNEFVLGVAFILQQLLPQYLQPSDIASDEEDEQEHELALSLLHVAKVVREFDLKFAELLNPSLKESFYCTNSFSPISSWDFGILIHVLLREEYFECWMKAETHFLRDKIQACFKEAEAWDMISKEDLIDTADQHGDRSEDIVAASAIPVCVDQLCSLMIEYINFSRSIPNGHFRTEFLDSVCTLILQSLFSKLSWRVDSYDAYGDTSRHLAIQAATSCLTSISYVEETILDQSIYDPHTTDVAGFHKFAKDFINHIRKWSCKLVKLVTKELESKGVPKLARQLRQLYQDNTCIDSEEIQMEFLAIFEDLLIEIRDIRQKVSSDIFRTIWTSTAACVNSQLFNYTAIGVPHNKDTKAAFMEVAAKCANAFEEFTRRPTTYFNLVVEASQVFYMSKEERDALSEQLGSLRESESAQLLKDSFNLQALSPLQVSQLLGTILD